MASATTASTARRSLLGLPISPVAPPYHLPPDSLFPTTKSLFGLSSYDAPEDLGQSGPVALKEGDPVPPSMLRRSRQIRGGGCFTYTSPLPLEFPYDIREEEDTERTNSAKPSTIETQLAKFEVSPSVPVWDAARGPQNDGEAATAFSSVVREGERFPKATLLSVSQPLLRDWLPNLDIGKEEGTEQEKAVRQQFVDVVAGKTVLAREASEKGKGTDVVGGQGFAPWSLCYAGHQFGSFAGQLGDGRAISILSTPPTEEVASRTGFRAIELQLKGAGRTPYSRFADGLAVLRSSIREYLGAEAVSALNIPTSRALALVHLPDVKVRREMMESAAIVTRVSGSWIRIGNFEMQAARGENDSLRKLSHYVACEVFGFSDANPAGVGASRSLSLNVLREVARRNALTVAGWQAYGFMHGVMNTDNIAVNGATIDYGPYAFMDAFDAQHICNHSDDMGRYSFANQPTMMLFAVHKLGDAIAELIGHEVELAEKAEGSGFVEAADGWAEGAEEVGELKEWREKGLKEVEKVKGDFVKIFKAEYERLMRLRLGFTTDDEGDFQLFTNYLDLLQQHELDFTHSHRLLTQFTSTSSPSFQHLLDALLPPASSSSSTARTDWTSWFKSYEARLAKDGADAASTRRQRMDAVNPRFTLRQWVLEETIRKVDKEGAAGVEQLERVLDMALNPFEAYGEPEVEKGETDEGACPTKEEQERQRLCGTGPKDMLGFQCSCSS
ncbi:hypothetical protein JCM6882_007038 [Rhodosporidiobolus microsporus]